MISPTSTMGRRASGWMASLVFAISLQATPREDVVAAVAADPAAHEMLVRLCDDWGGRLSGSAANDGALEQLANELRQLGLAPERVPFDMPGWERGEDRVMLASPIARPLRAAALAYAQPQPRFTAAVADLPRAPGEVAADRDLRGCVGLVDPSSPTSVAEWSEWAAARGLRGLLFLNRVAGGQLLARTSSFQGRPLPVPAYSLVQEEGRWLQRLCARGLTPRVTMETRSRARDVKTANLVVRFPGRSADTVVVGAHFDSWDLGQGAIDNGLGIAQLFALAKVLRGRELARTVELVWFNGEEQGLWGSRHQAGALGDQPIVAMINLDMVGVPTGVNALGDESLVPALERWHASRPTPLPQGVQNVNWFGSDHTSYQLAGVRALTFHAPIDPEAVRYYHDLADTVDKVPAKLVMDSTAVIADVLLALVEDPELTPWRRSEADTAALFTRFNLERRVQAAGLWRWPTP